MATTSHCDIDDEVDHLIIWEFWGYTHTYSQGNASFGFAWTDNSYLQMYYCGVSSAVS
jgi:hypothetical protein